MATRTAVASGLWSAAGTWDTGVPVNGDTAVIPLAYDVEFDVDQSGFASGVTVTLNGTLHASTTAGSYVLKLAANMTGSGTLRAGTSGTPYPTNCTFQISRNTFEITATSMTLDLNCSEPTVKWCKLSATEAAGQTVLSVDTDLTGYPAYWYDGAILRICDVNFGNDNEERIIAAGGVAASTITITAGLSAQKETGAYVALVSRNVKITHTSNTGFGINGAGGAGRCYAEVQGASICYTGLSGVTIGGTMSDATSGVGSGGGNVINAVICGMTNGVSGGTGYILNDLIAGCTNGISTGAGFIINSTVTIAGCSSGVANGAGHVLLGSVITGCTRGVNGGSGFSFVNVTFTNNTQDFDGVPFFTAYNTALGGATEFTNYNGVARPINAFAESIDHDQVAGAYKAWARGGIVTKTTSPTPTGYDYSYDHACESATYYCFQNFAVTVPAGGGLVVQCEMRKDSSMSYLPRVWILLPGVEPFISGSPSYEAIMTNSVDTWETLILVYANSTTAPVTVTVRTVAQNATGHVYTYPINTVLAPATYDVYSTLEADITDIQSRLPTTLVSGRMDSYVGAISGSVVTTIQSGLSTLTSQQVWEYSTRTITSFGTLISDIVTGLTTGTYQGRDYRDIWLDVWKQAVGNSTANDPDDPTQTTHKSPDESTTLVFDYTDTTRDWSE